MVTFADITGDGRAEYIIQFDGGAANAYNNTGNIPDAGKPRNWDSMGTIAGGVTPQGPVVYADIDGDGKDDYLVVFEDGRVNAYINTCDWKPIPSNDNGGGGGSGGGGDDGEGDNESEMPYAAIDPYMEGCSDSQQKVILEAWRDAGEVAVVHHQWSPKGKWQDATTSSSSTIRRHRTRPGCWTTNRAFQPSRNPGRLGATRERQRDCIQASPEVWGPEALRRWLYRANSLSVSPSSSSCKSARQRCSVC